jgi:Tol biopolymer transport system component
MNHLTRIACVFAALLVIAFIPLQASGDERPRASYYKNGEIHITVLGTLETKAITSGHWDFKPSWSRTDNRLVFFRRLKDDPDVKNWITAMCVINTDGTGFHQLSDGTHTDFNPTWTRDGSNTPVWNRKVKGKLSYHIMGSKVGGKPGEEIALTDPSYHAWVHSALSDGRLFVAATHPKQGRGYYLMTPNAGGEPKFEHVECELADKGILDRISVSPSESKICFEYQTGFKYEFPGRTLYVADFDVKQRTISNLKSFANAEGKRIWFAYPRWTKEESSIVYHAGGKLFLYTLGDGTTKQVSTDDKADYRYPHGEATPN